MVRSKNFKIFWGSHWDLHLYYNNIFTYHSIAYENLAVPVQKPTWRLPTSDYVENFLEFSFLMAELALLCPITSGLFGHGMRLAPDFAAEKALPKYAALQIGARRALCNAHPAPSLRLSFFASDRDWWSVCLAINQMVKRW